MNASIRRGEERRAAPRLILSSFGSCRSGRVEARQVEHSQAHTWTHVGPDTINTPAMSMAICAGGLRLPLRSQSASLRSGGCRYRTVITSAKGPDSNEQRRGLLKGLIGGALAVTQVRSARGKRSSERERERVNG